MDINYHALSFGADPELFFTNSKGEIIGAEKVMPKEGIGYMDSDWSADPTGKTMKMVKAYVIIDGVAGELQPSPATCRQTFSRNLQNDFRYLKDYITRNNIDATVSFAQSVTVSEHEMASLAPENQQLGCTPSLNAYGDNPLPVLTPENMYQRSAGGHLHFGPQDSVTLAMFKEKPDLVVRILDIVVGNTCVLLDTDPANAVRRQMYGRAGEYRLPKHGLEYRVLSNFWLQRYTVMSFVMTLSRFAIAIAADEKATAELLKLVDLDKIQQAINTNDFSKAYDNFNKIKKFLKDVKITRDSAHDFDPLGGERMDKFEVVVKRGLKSYFKKNPLSHWIEQSEVGGDGDGWETFVDGIELPETGITKAKNAVKDTAQRVFTSVASNF